MPMPSRLDKSKLDELCTCGHKRSEHEMSYFAQAIRMSQAQADELGLHGHGGLAESNCTQFTFKTFIDKDGNIVE